MDDCTTVLTTKEHPNLDSRVSYPDSTPDLLLSAALHYARKGIPILPVRIWRDEGGRLNKKPCIRKWPTRATTNEKQLRRWWGKWPEAQPAFPTGKRSGIMVVDEDREGALAEAGIELPRTTAVRTGSGNRQYYLHHVEGVRNSAGKLAPDVDIRGEGGYAVAVPSQGVWGCYEWLERAPVAGCPDDLAEKMRNLRRRPEPGRGASSLSSDRLTSLGNSPIPEGQRNDTLFFRTLDRRGQGFDHAQALAAALEDNASLCQPPLPEEEVHTLVGSAFRPEYHPPHREPGPEVHEALDRIERRWRETVWTHRGELTYSDMNWERVAIGIARRYGWLDGNGQVRVTASYLSFRLAAKTSPERISKSIKPRLARAARAYRIDGGRGPDKAGTWILTVPPAPTDNNYTSGCDTNPPAPPCPTIVGSRAPSLQDIRTPIWRYAGHVRSSRAPILHAAEEHPGCDIERLRDVAAPQSRLRDFRKRVEVLAGLGLLEERDGRIWIPGDYEERCEELKELSYSTVRTVKHYSYDHEVDIFFVSETREVGRFASENERDQSDIADAEEKRRQWREALDRKCRADNDEATLHFDQLQPVPDPRPEPADGEMTPDRALLTARGWECCGWSFGLVEWREPITHEVRREDIAAEIERRRAA